MATKEQATTHSGGATEDPAPAVAPGLVPGDAKAVGDTKADKREAGAHVLDYCDQVEAELATLEDGIKQIRSAAKSLKAAPDAGLLGDLRNIIAEVVHSIPLLRSAQGPRAHIEARTLPAPDVNDPRTVSATGAEPIL